MTILIRPLTVMAAACLITAPAIATPPKAVIPPTAARPLERALGEKLGAGLDLQSAAIARDHVVVTFGAGDDGPVGLTVTLRHPSVVEGAVHVGPAFSIHSDQPSHGSITKLQGRLGDLDVKTFWYTPEPPPAKAEPAHEADAPDHQQEAEDALRLALHAGRIDDQDVARSRLDALEKDARLRMAAGLELAEAWYRIGDPARGARAAATFLSTVSFVEPMDAIRGGVLKGQALTVPDLRAALAHAKHECKVGALGRSMEAVGRLEDAHVLLGELFDKAGCMEAALERIAWHVAAHDFPAADTLSAALLKRHPESEEAIGRRAQVLLALKRPVEAVELLEPVVWKNPHSGLLSALLGVYNRVPDDEWQDRKRAEIVAKAAADSEDHTAAFYAGVLLHYDGQFAASDVKLKPLLEVFGEQPRLFIYLGMNAFNLGDAPGALALLKRGEALQAPDPDIYYCRAEVNRFSDPSAAAEDLRRYLAQTRGSPTANPKKRERVETMANTLAACIKAGGPVPCPGPWEHPHGHAANAPAPDPARPQGMPVMWGLIVALLLALGAWKFMRPSASSSA